MRIRKGNYIPVRNTIVFPADWSKSQLLDYVRAVHPEETARIVKWNEVLDKTGHARLWMVNPRAFSNFKKGTLKR